MTLILLRHPSTRAKGICYGHTDVALSDSAREEIQRALEITPVARRIVSSDLSRALTLASRIGARDGVPVERDPRLRELYFGEWENVPWSVIGEEASGRWAADPWHIAPPGGERFGEMSRRVNDALCELDPGTIVVAHAGPIRAAQVAREGVEFTDIFRNPVPFATPIELTLSRPWPPDPS